MFGIKKMASNISSSPALTFELIARCSVSTHLSAPAMANDSDTWARQQEPEHPQSRSPMARCNCPCSCLLRLRRR